MSNKLTFLSEGSKIKNTRVTSIVVFILLLIVILVSFIALKSQKENDLVDNKQIDTKSATNNEKSESINGAAQPQVASTQDLLVYLIEEEKLAHDVYTIMYQKYGARVFGNILESESTHQSRVLELLQSRNIPDPRQKELGKFNNQELQRLYDALIAQGNQNATEAYKVGVAIEEKDIADISNQLATATDSDVISKLEALRQGSENHLRAFNRQIN